MFIKTLLTSTRFWAVVATVVTGLLQDKLNLTPEQITQFIMAIGAWIGGETKRPTSLTGATFLEKITDLTKSNRFWVTITSICIALFSEKFNISPDTITQIIALISGLVVAQSLRSSDPKANK